MPTRNGRAAPTAGLTSTTCSCASRSESRDDPARPRGVVEPAYNPGVAVAAACRHGGRRTGGRRLVDFARCDQRTQGRALPLRHLKRSPHYRLRRPRHDRRVSVPDDHADRAHHTIPLADRHGEDDHLSRGGRGYTAAGVGVQLAIVLPWSSLEISCWRLNRRSDSLAVAVAADRERLNAGPARMMATCHPRQTMSSTIYVHGPDRVRVGLICAFRLPMGGCGRVGW